MIHIRYDNIKINLNKHIRYYTYCIYIYIYIYIYILCILLYHFLLLIFYVVKRVSHIINVITILFLLMTYVIFIKCALLCKRILYLELFKLEGNFPCEYISECMMYLHIILLGFCMQSN